jgi:putative endonuclease
MERQPCVYVLASKRNGTLYAGVTSNLVKRVWEHKQHVVEGFTKKYRVTRLVWYEVHETMESAIRRNDGGYCNDRKWPN